MSLKRKGGLILATSAIVLASASAGFAGYHAAISYTDAQLSKLEVAFEESQKLDADRFEVRVEKALESIVSERKEAARTSKPAVKSSNSSLSMNDDGQVVYGNPDATYTIYTFSDFRCSYCSRFHPLVESVVDGSDGDINFIYKPYPVLGPASQSLAKAGECIAKEEGPEAFWRFADKAYQTKNWITSIAQSQLKDVQNIKECVEQNRYGKVITQSLDEGQELGITGTPSSVFRNNDSGQGAFIPGYIEADQVRQMIEEIK